MDGWMHLGRCSWPLILLCYWYFPYHLSLNGWKLAPIVKHQDCCFYHRLPGSRPLYLPCTAFTAISFVGPNWVHLSTGNYKVHIPSQEHPYKGTTGCPSYSRCEWMGEQGIDFTHRVTWLAGDVTYSEIQDSIGERLATGEPDLSLRELLLDG